ncbi:oxygen-independent coproporphyrinogen III oxidase [Lichenihabitans sp. Uapishka_5]|uniref:oxygen-independent coproporphyrinogen III oxidase n=1 Tax=Lichenihabitans sp. Uapishka_5 TaxID=3037302 RepID=UPI0029E7EA56|nr:oxygen-independent coproporphyrinogen III oxidase [Lichenihabitans sp. Uapishka_5]MDX7952345.1 oxygen-independent coproporphyrinogen III oxidase [Lichenihabitans sp. Uapishka_5]
MTSRLVQRYAGLAVPRYTSYPTAAEFTAAVGPADQARWLGTLNPGEPVSLYLHVPYCRDICHYCGCATMMVSRDAVLARYRHALECEIDRVGRHLLRRPRVAHLHWGGGTPSLLGAAGLAAVLDRLASHFTFDDGYEHAIELDPRSVTPMLAWDLARLGCNRVSLGVQDLDPKVQIAIGRVQPLDVVGSAFAALRDAGIARINVDLIYGLPRQTTASVEETVREVAALSPNRVACYGYAHLPQRKRNQRLIDTASLPNVVERFAQARAIAASFERAGYEAIGIDHFAQLGDALAVTSRQGSLHRNFQGYTDDQSRTLIGFGASAISRLGFGYVQNITDPVAYETAVARGEMPVARGYSLTDEDRSRGAIIEQLMCSHRVDLAAVDPTRTYADELALLRPMVSDGLVTLAGGTVAVTAIGRPFVRVVAAIFDAHRQGGASQPFSLAV